MIKIFVLLLIFLCLVFACKSNELQKDYEPEVIVHTTIYMNSFKHGDKTQFEKIINQKIIKKESDKYIIEEKNTTEKTFCDKGDCETTIEDSIKGTIYKKKHKINEKIYKEGL